MASKSARKEGKKGDDLAGANMAALTKLLEEHGTALSAEFKSAVTSLETKLDCVQATISDHGHRLTSLEANSNIVSDKLEGIEVKLAVLENSYDKLKAKTIDLESRSRSTRVS